MFLYTYMTRYDKKEQHLFKAMVSFQMIYMKKYYSAIRWNAICWTIPFLNKQCNPW